MKLRRFFGLTSRAVLEQVRNELGPDALIIANRATAEGVEITRWPATAVAAIDGGERAGAGAPPASARRAAPSHRSAPRGAAAAAMPRPRRLAIGAGAPSSADAARTRAGRRCATTSPVLRALLETQLAQLAWSDTLRRIRCARSSRASSCPPATARRWRAS